MPLADVVKVNIAVLSAGITQEGFGVPLILSHSATWVERTRTYVSLPGVVADFAAGTPEYLAAQALFSQSPAPDTIMIGRSAVKPTQLHVITVSAVANLTTYTVRIGAQTASYTSDGSATNDEIAAGLVAAINALAAPALGTTATLTGSVGAKTVTLTGNAPGNWTAVEVLRVDLLSIAQTHADPGIAADLNACLDESAVWYTLVTTFNSQLYVAAAAAWVEANERLYLVTSQDTAIITVPFGSATDIAHQLDVAAYTRTSVSYHPAGDAFLDASWDGAGLPTSPGSETWKFFTLAGVPATVLTGTHIANLTAKNANWYYNVQGKNITAPGMVASGEWIDVIRFRDWLKVQLQEQLFVLLTQGAGAAIPGLIVPLKKVPMTDKGIALVENVIRAVLRLGVAVGGLSDNPAPTVNVPKAASLSVLDKSARKLTGVTFTAVLAGAIHVIAINGTLSE